MNPLIELERAAERRDIELGIAGAIVFCLSFIATLLMTAGLGCGT